MSSDLKTQVEYYLSDNNLKKDRFFHTKISTAKEGWIPISLILNCNKVKSLGATANSIAEAVESSDKVEVSMDKKQIRRTDNKQLPELQESQGSAGKRESKAKEKEEKQQKRAAKLEEQKAEEDPNAEVVLTEKDFSNPLIIRFTGEGDVKDDDKSQWKGVEKAVKEKYPKMKITYSRSAGAKGELAVSQFKADASLVDLLCENPITVEKVKYTFSKLEGTELNAFWQNDGSHYQFCIKSKLRNIKKQQKLNKQKEQKKEGGAKRAKISYEIAGKFYADIGKVKSKSRAILNLKEDGDKLTGDDEKFMKEIIACHDKKDAKMKEFSHFEVGTHPEYAKTRCFFVVNKDGKKEDFSVSKCILALEEKFKE